MLVGNSRRIMGDRVNGLWLNVLGWTTAAVMAAAGVAYIGNALSRPRLP
jgi:Mn2+/Fe2+ NRAMP family transporter